MHVALNRGFTYIQIKLLTPLAEVPEVGLDLRHKTVPSFSVGLAYYTLRSLTPVGGSSRRPEDFLLPFSRTVQASVVCRLYLRRRCSVQPLGFQPLCFF